MIVNNASHFPAIKFSLLFEQFCVDRVKLKCTFADENKENNENQSSAPTGATNNQVNVVNTSLLGDSAIKKNLNIQTADALPVKDGKPEISSDTKIPGYIKIIDISGRPVALEIESGNEPVDEIDARYQKFYICLTCGKLLASKRNSLAHSYVHTGEKRFACHLCEKKYYYKSGLITHQRAHHMIRKPISLLPYTCEICGKHLKNKTTLARHRNTVHPKVTNFVCSSCGKGFYYKRYYREHMNREMRKNLNLTMIAPKMNMLENLINLGSLD